MKIKLQLVEDWKQSWKWLSMHGMAVAAAVQASWVSLPDDWRAAVPVGVVAGITLAALAVGAAGRLVDQAPQK